MRFPNDGDMLMGRPRKLSGGSTLKPKSKLESMFKCKKCGYVIHTDYVPFRSLTKKCPECGAEEFKKIYRL